MVICGNISILGLIAYVLMDLVATHSFISKILVKSLEVEPETLEIEYLVFVPSRELMESNKVVGRYPVRIGGRDLVVDLIVLDL